MIITEKLKSNAVCCGSHRNCLSGGVAWTAFSFSVSGDGIKQNKEGEL